jgi:tetratricopeptide (TPR) repeat protein
MTRTILFISLLAGWGLFSLPASSSAQTTVDPRDSMRLSACITKIESAPLEAYEDGLVWRQQGGSVFAEQCIALARIANGDVRDGAARLAALATAPDAGDGEQRALLLSKAANAWLMVSEFDGARRALTAALALKANDGDLLIDRARAYAGLLDWAKARDDLTLALSVRPMEVLIFRLRAETHLQLRNYEAAQADVDQALLLAPREIDTYLIRGRVSEARRLGRAPD